MSLIIISIIFCSFTISNLAPSCEDFTNFCEHCNIYTNLCVKCQYSDILIPDKNGGCIGAQKCTLGDNNCNECEINGNLCKTCEESYYPDENGGCAYTEGCEISYMGECIKCKVGYILIGKENELKICRSLSIDYYKNCETINYETGYCSICEDGFFLTSKGHKCIKTENCEKSTFGNCISCIQGYYLNKNEDKCELKPVKFSHCKESRDGKICDICEDGYYLDENGICVRTKFCSESVNYLCQKCKQGYYLITDTSNNICINTNNCQKVDPITLTCILCKPGYYLDLKDYKCKSNLEDGPFKFCQIVENGLCIKCDNNHYIGEDYKCSDTLYCSESENGKCLVCKDNYFLGLDNFCTDVENCIYSESNRCKECDIWYYYDPYFKKCFEMSEEFLNCKVACEYNSNSCCECKDDYYIVEYSPFCYDNSKEGPFFKCAIVDYKKEYCKKCIEGYFLGIDDDKCSKIENCKKSENGNKCLECDTYYCLDAKNQVCLQNDFLSENNDKIHISCNRTNEEGTACAECINGYELNDEGLCVDIDICEEKIDGKCNKCKDIISPNGNNYCANEIFGCLETPIYDCLRCDNLTDLYECTEYKKRNYISSFLFEIN